MPTGGTLSGLEMGNPMCHSQNYLAQNFARYLAYTVLERGSRANNRETVGSPQRECPAPWVIPAAPGQEARLPAGVNGVVPAPLPSRSGLAGRHRARHVKMVP